jgi:hypothetical protein
LFSLSNFCDLINGSWLFESFDLSFASDVFLFFSSFSFSFFSILSFFSNVLSVLNIVASGICISGAFILPPIPLKNPLNPFLFSLFISFFLFVSISNSRLLLGIFFGAFFILVGLKDSALFLSLIFDIGSFFEIVSLAI